MIGRIDPDLVRLAKRLRLGPILSTLPEAIQQLGLDVRGARRRD
jgi:hypothetical protein